MKKIIFFMFVAVLSACASNHKAATSKSEQPKNSKILYLLPAKFSDNLTVTKIEKECSMLLSITDSILSYAKENSLNIEYVNELVEVPEDQSALLIEYEEIIPHKWKLFAVRPSSIATVKATLLNDTKEVDAMSKRIGSGVAFGACDRLEKIAVSGGTQIARWVATSNY
jgi:hypothetical protein